MSTRNPAIRRIQEDVRELRRHPSNRYYAEPLEDNMFEWHFTVRGPKHSHFEGGVYHGRIILPAEYPYKPPNIVFLTKNGRFEVGTKICLSITAHHKEEWQPAWGIRTMLEALISFFPTDGFGAIGSLDWSEAERQQLAVLSQDYVCPRCGSIRDIVDENMCKTIDEGKDNSTGPDNETLERIAQLNMRGSPSASASATASASVSAPILPQENTNPISNPPRSSSAETTSEVAGGHGRVFGFHKPHFYEGDSLFDRFLVLMIYFTILLILMLLALKLRGLIQGITEMIF
jgi:ubiquitin-conjugating enzyme E2 J1